jgi:hypothetical protein
MKAVYRIPIRCIIGPFHSLLRILVLVGHLQRFRVWGDIEWNIQNLIVADFIIRVGAIGEV